MTNKCPDPKKGVDVIGVAEPRTHISSGAIIGIAVTGVLLLLLIVDFLCCITVNVGILATLCRRTKRSPSDLDEEKLGRDENEKQPLNGINGNGVKKNSSVEFDGRVTHSRSGDIIGKNSAV